MTQIEVSIVIPVYNSYHSIKEVVNRIKDTLLKEKVSYEIILVDDYSMDNTLLILNELKRKDTSIRVLPLKSNIGQQGAIKYGIQRSVGKYIITMDDDLEHKPENIPLLIEEIKKGYDVVYGISKRENYPIHRELGSRVVDIFFTVFFSKPKDIKVSSYRIIDEKIAKTIIKDNTPYVYLSAIILKITENIGNISMEHGERKYGKSNYNLLKLLKLFIQLIYYYKINNYRRNEEIGRNRCDC